MCCMVQVSFITNLQVHFVETTQNKTFCDFKNNGDTVVVLSRRVSRCDNKEANLQCCLAHQFSESFPGWWNACIKQESNYQHKTD